MACRLEEVSLHSHFKTGDTKLSENYQTISLISHSSKILLNSSEKSRRTHKQVGFKKRYQGKYSKYTIVNGGCMRSNKDDYLCFVDNTEVVDCVIRDLLSTTLNNTSAPKYLSNSYNPCIMSHSENRSRRNLMDEH